jgi:hypothetical protein
MSPADELLEQLSSRGPYLDDCGFTARLLARLPPRRQRWRRLVLGTAFGLALATALVLYPELLALLDRLCSGAAVAAVVSAASAVVPLALFAAAVGVAVGVTVTGDRIT